MLRGEESEKEIKYFKENSINTSLPFLVGELKKQIFSKNFHLKWTVVKAIVIFFKN